MKRSQVWLSVLVFVVISTSQTTYGSCGSLVLPWDNLHETDAVFRGQVTHVGTATVLHEVFNWGHPVTFQVLESWKGVTTTTSTIKAQANPTIAVRFEQGQQYLVYADYEQPLGRGPLTTNGCKGTKPIAEARADLHALGASVIVLQPAPATGSPYIIRVLLIGGALSVLFGAVTVARFRRRSS